MQELNSHEKWMLKQFTIINSVANTIYTRTHHGVNQNLYSCFIEYENGVFGWIKEATCYQIAINVYDELLANEGLEIIGQLEEILGDELKNMTYDEIKEWERKLSDIE